MYPERAAGWPDRPGSAASRARSCPSAQRLTPFAVPQAARLTLVQILMASKGVQMNPLQSLYYVSPACLVSLAVPFREPQPPGRTLGI